MRKKYNLSKNFTDFYRENGYVILTDLFSKQDLDQARSDIFSLFETRFMETNKEKLTENSLLTFYYEKEKEMWKQCARRMFDLLSVYSLATKLDVLKMLKKIELKTPLISTRPEVRTDMPKDEQYRQPWHQDWRYGQGSLNAVTIWVSLHKVGVENGTIEVIPRTHLMGYLETEELSNPRRFLIIDSRLKDLPHFPVELEFGESIVFSQMLVHRSGYNQTNLPRLTVQLRFVDYSESSFVANGFPSPTGSDLLWKYPPSEEDMKRVFETYH